MDAILLDSLGRVRNAAGGVTQRHHSVNAARRGDMHDSHVAQHGGGDDEQSLGSSAELQCRCCHFCVFFPHPVIWKSRRDCSVCRCVFEGFPLYRSCLFYVTAKRML